ncbi:MAG: YfhO family protein [Lachnospiraceae bacterium]|nr:YfhO family protein [Lachnospiraceae bacterium]
MTGIMIATKCEPFGTNSLMIVDALHQYLPFFADYQNKLQSLDGWFYSWNGGIGYNFYSLWAYYLSSPLNLVIAIVPKLTMISVLNWLISLKFALCSLTGFLYFTHREGKQSLKNVAFGMCYAFSSYMTGYYWNVMWLEVMILLPIILIGMDWMIEGKGCRLYILALFGSMFCNYYMSFMVCFFLALWYFTYYYTSIKEFLSRAVTFALSSLLAAAMASIVLIPAYQGLMTTSSAHFELPGWTSHNDWLRLFSTHMIAVPPHNMSVDDGLGNLYLGLLPLIVFILYIVDHKIAWKEKLSKLVILAFLVASFEIKNLNYVWHGFHNQYGIPNRFAFLYIFLILIMAYEQMTKMEHEKVAIWKIFLALAILFAGIGYVYKQETYSEIYIYAISAGVIALYGILLAIPKRVARTVLYIFMITEICANGIYGFSQSGQIEADYYFSDTLAIKDIVKRSKPNIENRMELIETKMLDEAIWYTMDSFTMFGSTALGDTVDAMDQFGFYTGVNEYLYEGATPFTDMLFGVRSILCRSTDLMYRTHYEYVYSFKDVSLYQHNLPTAIGYYMDKDAIDFDDSSWNPFEVQNNLVSAAFANAPIFYDLEIPEPVGDDCKIDVHEDGQCYVKVDEDNSIYQATVTYRFEVDEDQEMYLHFDGSKVDEAKLSINDIEMQNGRKDSQIITVGHVKAGDTVELMLWLKEGQEGTGSITLRAAALDERAFETLYQTMAKRKFHLEDHKSAFVKGTVNALDDGIVYFAIPYDDGWDVIVDDVPAETKRFAGGFLAVDVQKGTHEIRLKYQPPGFFLGLKVSLAGWIIFLLGIFISGRRKNKLQKNTLELSGGNDNEEIDEDCSALPVHDDAL